MHVRIMVALVCFTPTPTRATTTLLLSDAQSSTKPVILLEHAIIEKLNQLENNTTIDLFSGVDRANKALRALQQAENLRESGREKFDQLEMDGALKRYSKALRQLEKTPSPDLDALRDTLAMLAATNLLIGQDRRGRAMLDRLMVIDIDAQPDESAFNPQTINVFQAAVARVRNAPTFDVQVSAEPPDAAIFFDGKLAGVSPVTIREVRPGRHYVTASLKGFQTTGRSWDIKPRSSKSLALRLRDTPHDSALLAKIGSAINAIDDPQVPPDADELRASFRADRVILVAVRRGKFYLVHYEANGGNRFVTQAPTDIFDVEAARTAAAQMLAPLFGGAVPPPPADDDPVDTTIAATDPVYTDDFGAPRADVAPTPTSPLDPATLNQSDDGSSKTGVLIAFYAGAAALAAAGGIFGYLAYSAQEKYGQYASDPESLQTLHEETIDQKEGVEIAAEGQRNALIADIFYGTAIAAAIAGICIHLLWDDDPGITAGSSGAFALGLGSLQLRL